MLRQRYRLADHGDSPSKDARDSDDEIERKPNEQGLLFATTHGTPLANSDVFRCRLHPILDDLNNPRPARMGLHDLRYGSATVLDVRGVLLGVGQERLGGNIQTTLSTHPPVRRR
jgi:hypothetical protein